MEWEINIVAAQSNNLLRLHKAFPSMRTRISENNFRRLVESVPKNWKQSNTYWQVKVRAFGDNSRSKRLQQKVSTKLSFFEQASDPLFCNHSNWAWLRQPIMGVISVATHLNKYNAMICAQLSNRIRYFTQIIVPVMQQLSECVLLRSVVVKKINATQQALRDCLKAYRLQTKQQLLNVPFITSRVIR